MLSALLIIPFLGALLIGIWPEQLTAQRAQRLALVCLGANLILTLLLLFKFDVSSSALQLQESLPWLEALGLGYELGVDGLALPLVVINSFLSLVAVYASSETIPRPRLYYPMILLITGAVAGAFLAQNLLLFFIFYELELIPLYLLIAIWGGARRSYAATKFLIYTEIGRAHV